MEFVQIEVTERETRGSKHARRQRRAGYVPAVLYGLGRKNLSLTISEEEVRRFLRTGSHLLELRLGDQTRPAIMREVQHDPVTDEILHIDFHRVDKDAEIEDDVHLTYKGVAKGAREGGLFLAIEESVTVRCRPHLIPSEIIVDVSGLAIGDAVHASDLTVPEGVTLVTPADAVLAHVQMPRLAPEPSAEPAISAADVPLVSDDEEQDEGGDEEQD